MAAPSARKSGPAPTESQLHYIAVCLAAVSGFVDAAGFLQMGGIYVSFMSGNSTRLGVGLPSFSGTALKAAFIIAVFVAGVMAGSLISAAAPSRRKPLVLAAASIGLFGGALLQALGWQFAAVIAAALAMGCLNTVFQAEDGPYNIGITYMTGNLVKFAEGVVGAATGHPRAWWPYLLLWLGLIAGAAAGAEVFGAIGLGSLWIAAAATALLAVLARDVRSRPLGESPPSGR